MQSSSNMTPAEYNKNKGADVAPQGSWNQASKAGDILKYDHPLSGMPEPDLKKVVFDSTTHTVQSGEDIAMGHATKGIAEVNYEKAVHDDKSFFEKSKETFMHMKDAIVEKAQDWKEAIVGGGGESGHVETTTSITKGNPDREHWSHHQTKMIPEGDQPSKGIMESGMEKLQDFKEAVVDKASFLKEKVMGEATTMSPKLNPTDLEQRVSTGEHWQQPIQKPSEEERILSARDPPAFNTMKGDELAYNKPGLGPASIHDWKAHEGFQAGKSEQATVPVQIKEGMFVPPAQAKGALHSKE
jgi:hypothetical protein